MRLFAAAAMLALAALFAACAGSDGKGSGTTAAPTAIPTDTKLSITSDAFADNATIPTTFTCSGDNISPALSWDRVPDGTAAFALIMDDPDAPVAGGFVHWVIYDIPADAGGLPERVPAGDTTAEGATQGANGAGQRGYAGPCPPAGAPHHYRFRLFALDAPLALDPGKSRADVEAAMQGHIIDEALLTGLFGR